MKHTQETDYAVSVTVLHDVWKRQFLCEFSCSNLPVFISDAAKITGWVNKKQTDLQEQYFLNRVVKRFIIYSMTVRISKI
jgi:hypothetical protein